MAPLSLPDAGRLLDAQPCPPRGRPREQVLAQAAGNPLALIELSKMIAADPDAGRRWAAEPLPLTDQLTAVMIAQYADLPRTARAALLVAAVADRSDLPAAAIPGLSGGALAPAEAAGLIRLDPPGPQFTHPLVRSAVYHAAPFAERAAAHLRVADALRDQPDRYAWHRAAAALEPDEQVAALLERSAVQAQRRGGAAAAARALERAAELSPGQPDKARRLLSAAELAHHPSGQADWVTRAGRPGPHADLRSGPAHRRPAQHRLVTAVVQPECRGPRHAHLGRRRGRPEAAGPRLGRHRDGGHGRSPDRDSPSLRQGPGRPRRARRPGPSRTRRPKPGRPVPLTSSGYGSGPARTRSVPGPKLSPTCGG